MVITIEPIIPTDLISKDLAAEITKEVTKEVIQETRDIEDLFGKATKTWSATDKPRWKKTIKFRGNDLVGKTVTSDTPFAYVELGTKSRWRRMSKGFRAKTKPGVLGSTAGRGGAVGWFSRSDIARSKGITARSFRTIVADRRRPLFAARILAAFNRAISRFS